MTPTQARLTPNLIPFGCPKKLFIALFLSPAFYGFFAALLPTIRLTCKIYIFWCRRVNSLTRRQLTTLFPVVPQLPLLMEIAPTEVVEVVSGLGFRKVANWRGLCLHFGWRHGITFSRRMGTSANLICKLAIARRKCRSCCCRPRNASGVN